MLHDDPSERGICLDRTAINFAVSEIMNSTGSSIIMAIDQTSGVVINQTLGVVGNLAAPNINTKTKIGSALSRKSNNHNNN